MSKRLLVMLAVIFLPFAAAADDTPAPTDTPAATPAPAAAPDSAPSAGLGPQTAGGAGGSNADSGALQPAGVSPLQSTTLDAAGITAPSSALQAPVTSDAALKVLAGEADGAPQSLAGEEPEPTWPWALAAVLLSAAIGAAVLYRDRRRFGRSKP